MQETWVQSGWGRSPGERNGYPLQYSCLENSMDRGAWWPVGSQRVKYDCATNILTFCGAPVKIFMDSLLLNPKILFLSMDLKSFKDVKLIKMMSSTVSTPKAFIVCQHCARSWRPCRNSWYLYRRYWTNDVKAQDSRDHIWLSLRLHLGFPGGSEVKASACNAGDLGSIPGLGRSPREGNGNPLQYSCLENPMDGGAWWATVHRVAKSRTWLTDLTNLSLHLGDKIFEMTLKLHFSMQKHLLHWAVLALYTIFKLIFYWLCFPVLLWWAY